MFSAVLISKGEAGQSAEVTQLEQRATEVAQREADAIERIGAVEAREAACAANEARLRQIEEDAGE